MHGDLQQPGAVDAEPGLAAPHIGHAEESLGCRDEVGRETVALGDMRGGHEAAVREPGEGVPHLRHAQRRIHAEVQARAGFQIGRWVQKRAERLHPVRRRLQARG